MSYNGSNQPLPRKMRVRQRHRSGFTLLELILATAIMASIGGVLYSALSIAYKSRQAVSRQTDMVREASIVMRIIQRDLGSILPPSGTFAGPFVGTPAGMSGGASDELDFYTLGRDFTADDADVFSEGIRHVTLRLRTEQAPVVLVREVEENLLVPVQRDPVQEVLAADVSGLMFRYFDGTAWEDSWDSTAQNNTLPRAVEVTLVFDDPSNLQGDGMYRITQVIALSCAADAVDTTDDTGASDAQ